MGYIYVIYSVSGLYREKKKKKKNKPQTPRLSPFNSQDLISNSTYCLPYSSCDISFENLVLDQLTTLQMIFFLVSITCLLDCVLISLGKKFCLGHLWELKVKTGYETTLTYDWYVHGLCRFSSSSWEQHWLVCAQPPTSLHPVPWYKNKHGGQLREIIILIT